MPIFVHKKCVSCLVTFFLGRWKNGNGDVLSGCWRKFLVTKQIVNSLDKTGVAKQK